MSPLFHRGEPSFFTRIVVHRRELIVLDAERAIEVVSALPVHAFASHYTCPAESGMCKVVLERVLKDLAEVHNSTYVLRQLSW